MTWTVDTIAPDTTLLDGPPQDSTSPVGTATFSFASPESASRFECRLGNEAFAACESPLTRTGIPTGDHVFEVRGVDAAGNADATPARRDWRVNILDADADGFNRPQDCDDDNPAIHPGARDTPGNRIDEDCSGRPAPLPQLPSRILWSYDANPFRLTSLRVTKAPRGSRISVRCRGRGCPSKTVVRNLRKARNTVSVLGRLGKALLGRGATVEVSITKREHIGVMRRITVRSPAQAPRASFYCLPPKSRPRSC